jgi:hypothetical protein
MEREQTLYKEIQSLDSEMQTLVYENYNKFISATETIRKVFFIIFLFNYISIQSLINLFEYQMSSHFDKMEEELNLLSTNMEAITKSSEEISNNLKGRRQDLSKLATTHSVLTKLQFLFQLSPKMRSCIEQNCYNDAVKYYLRAERTLAQYCHFPSIKAINEECNDILKDLNIKLYQQLSNKEVMFSSKLSFLTFCFFSTNFLYFSNISLKKILSFFFVFY